MASKLKTIGVAFIAALALSGLAASSAGATEFTASSYPAEYAGSQVVKHKLVTDTFTTECEVAKFSGFFVAVSTTMTITPAYSGCKSAGITMTMTMNGCDYLLHLPAAGNDATMDLVCPAGQEMTIDIGAELSKPICQIHIPPFTGKSKVSLTNEAPGVLATFNLTGFKASLTDSQPFLCPFNGSTVSEAAVYTGTVKFTSAGKTIDVDSSAAPSEFTASSYPASYLGSQIEKHKLVTDGFTTECELAILIGTAYSASTTATMTPSYTGCKTAGIVSTMTMNGCDYLYHLTALGGAASADLVCPAGQEVTIDVGAEPKNPICEIHISPYTGKSSVTFENEAPGVLLNFGVSAIKANLTDTQPALCPFNGNTVSEASSYSGTTKITSSGKTIDIG